MLATRKKRTRFNVVGSKKELNELLSDTLFDDDKRNVFLSNGHFSSISFIMLVAEHAHIKDLFASTLRVGRKQAAILRTLQKNGRLDNVSLIVGGLQKRTDAKHEGYNYLDFIEKMAQDGNWRIEVLRNHSKIILMDTESGKVVIETSLNLNTNPTIEQFSLEVNEELYNYYLEALFKPTFNKEEDPQ